MLLALAGNHEYPSVRRLLACLSLEQPDLLPQEIRDHTGENRGSITVTL